MFSSLRRHWHAWRAEFDRCTEGVACGHRRRVHGPHGCGGYADFRRGVACQFTDGGTSYAPMICRHYFNGEEWPIRPPMREARRESA